MAKYLDSNGVTHLVTHINTIYAKKTDFSDYETAAEASAKYATQTALSTLDGRVDTLTAALGGVYHFKGSVANLAALDNIQNPEAGDVYNLVDTGMNVAYVAADITNGTEAYWDELGMPINLSNYALAADIPVVEPLTNADIDLAINAASTVSD